YFAVNEQIYASLPHVLSTADQKIDVLAFNRERGGGEFAFRVVAAAEAVHQSLTEETADGHLARQRAPGGLPSEGGPLHFPRSVVVPFEISDQHIGPLRSQSQRGYRNPAADDNSNHQFHDVFPATTFSTCGRAGMNADRWAVSILDRRRFPCP